MMKTIPNLEPVPSPATTDPWLHLATKAVLLGVKDAVKGDPQAVSWLTYGDLPGLVLAALDLEREILVEMLSNPAHLARVNGLWRRKTKQ